MSVLRQANLLGQGRVDVPHVRAIESSLCADFDLLAGKILAGGNPYVIQGFNVTTLTPGVDASQIQVSVADSVLLHPLASESGTIFSTAADRTTETLSATNPRVVGSFTAGTTNHIGIDLRRSADSDTSDLVQFADADTLQENPKSVPLARTLDYVLVISTQGFSSMPSVAPLANVVTDANNHVVSVEDARDLMFRLGSGGSVTNVFASYSWPGGRTEAGDNSDFLAGDKTIASFREWVMAFMTRLWELGGGQHWYSPTADRNSKMTRGGTTFTNGDWFEWDGTNLHWQGLKFIFENSTAYFNDIKDQASSSAGLTNLADGECIYVDVDRNANRTGGTALVPVKTTITGLGTPTVPGTRFIVAWRVGTNIFTRDAQFPVGASFTVATTSNTGVVKLHQDSITPLSPVVLTDGDLNTPNGVPQFNGNRALTVSIPTGGVNTTAFTASGLGTGNGIYGVGGAGGFNAGVQGQGSGNQGSGVVGLGSATDGAGVKGVGGGAGAGGEFTGGASGPAVTTHGDINNNGPQVRFKDSAGNTKATRDHLGYDLGHRLVAVKEDWIGWTGSSSSSLFSTAPAIVTGFNKWELSVCSGGGGGVKNLVGTNAYPYPSMAVLLPTAAGNTIFNLASPLCLQAAHESAVLESDAILTAMSGNWTAFVGFNDSANNWYAFYASSANANWHAYCLHGGSLTEQDTNLNTGVAVPIANNTVLHFRVELHGASSPYGSCARFFVNGVLTNTISTNQPTVDEPLVPSFRVSSTDTNAGRYLQIGGTSAVVNRALSALGA